MTDTMNSPTPSSPQVPNTLTSVTALARFEFEFGRGGQGSKVLMVEWQDDDATRHHAGTWHVHWLGKRTVFPTDDKPSDNIRRVYFLLPPTTVVPPNITLAYQPDTGDEPQKMTINALPAIFTKELGATAKATGKRGVLHTIWAKKRLQVLEQEIQREQDLNLEGIALEMALEEKTWIETNFGLQSKPTTLDLSGIPKLPNGPTSAGLQSPKSPTRLSEKLRGLSVGTTAEDLAPRGNVPTRDDHPLSPETTDVAQSFFTSFPRAPASPNSITAKRIVSQSPPDSVRRQQGLGAATFSSIATDTANKDDELFAVAMSPRTPGDPKSPFSFSNAEVGAFSKIKGDK